jgi:hypothetical protein
MNGPERSSLILHWRALDVPVFVEEKIQRNQETIEMFSHIHPILIWSVSFHAPQQDSHRNPPTEQHW